MVVEPQEHHEVLETIMRNMRVITDRLHHERTKDALARAAIFMCQNLTFDESDLHAREERLESLREYDFLPRDLKELTFDFLGIKQQIAGL